ncbi:MAG: hypothetical protein WAM66_09780 [Acidobacteriaceae bacterium]
MPIPPVLSSASCFVLGWFRMLTRLKSQDQKKAKDLAYLSLARPNLAIVEIKRAAYGKLTLTR